MILTRRVRLVAACAATLAVVVPLGWLWQASRLPRAYSVMDMGYADGGRQAGGPHHHQNAATRDITTLVADPARRPDVEVTLTAREQRLRLASGREIDGYTFNGRSPGPQITAVAGQLVQVRLVNESVPGGVTLHWHGVDVPGGEDGVAGVTQDAVRIGRDFVYRFIVRRAGTFWYHSHQLSHEQVAGGLFGALVVRPARPPAALDVVALAHLYHGIRTVNGSESDVTVPAPPGATARVRVVNTDNGPTPVWVTGAAWRLVAVDGTELHGPTAVERAAVLVTAGGRADLEVTMPSGGGSVRVQIGGPLSVVLGHPSGVPPSARPAATLDLLTYGSPAPLGFDPARPDRAFRYEMGRRPGFLDGVPGLYWTVNGHLYPDVPMFTVADGDVVRMTIVNGSGEVHPMHLHGHRAVVLARDGVPATGSPWWVDSLNVENGESYDIAFLADNPGIWVDHCHNLPHAREGLLVHLMYENVTTPFRIGGPAGNSRE
ncbi:multicopper oxidase family protein [Nonomuraea angiospora]|uniref:FtsP/CotA-like multicopper oxidase with cupredoxin domain n=1 Tax=Nonomuraea angiospora TaxID=46172 RepID=A0ABR9MLB0_9ACTN|nr:multicopper oxidase family protein [Nonomuraea angiospora]MBE1593504.1 FtsP/CotA-like multicopper oxidase with cupredoxin domain [Nonomuraea angiospora]